MIALLMDVGNSRIKWGVSEQGAVRRTGHISHARVKEQGLAALTSRLPRRVDAVLVSNVAGTSFGTRLSGVVGMHCGVEVHFAHSEREACGVVNSYAQPRRLGVDRWVALIGARTESETTCLVVDAGTAVTLDALDASGRHLGGQIIPGISLMAASLAEQTSDIPAVRRKAAGHDRGKTMFANTTAGALGEGALNAVAGAIERAASVLGSDGDELRVILTGGDASRILRSLGGAAEHRPHLVLQGLARILENRQ